MEGEESLLDAIHETIEDDVYMVDVEEGEIVLEHDLHSGEIENGDRDYRDKDKQGLFLGTRNGQHQPNKNNKRKKKKKTRRKVPMDLDRFVRDTCRRLKEKKSYMVYTAVGCLGVAALSDLVNEVEAIEACGGQVTADGSRKRTGGGVLWNIVKARQPAAHREIMKKTREFEKQFKHSSMIPKLGPQRHQGSPEGHASTNASADEALASEISVMPVAELNESKPQEERKSVHERIRIPVSYDDLFRELALDAS